MKPDDPLIPDRFQLLETLVSNDAEIQYRAMDTTLLREVILKRPGIAMTELLNDSGDQSRALRESRALAQIHHPGVNKLHDVIATDHGPIMVMEPIPGITLKEHLAAHGQLAVQEVRRLGIEIADALAAVHATGAVHRGLSEQNIVIRPDGTACLAGFLFAKFGKSSMVSTSIDYSATTEAGEPDAPRSSLLPEHPAPEQVMGHGADGRSDLFGLGCVLYRMLTGQPAFRDIVLHGWSQPTQVEKLAPGSPKDLVAVVMKCVSSSPLGRYQSAAEVRAAIEATAKATARRRTALIATMAVAVLALLVAGFMKIGDEAPAGTPISPDDDGRGRRPASSVDRAHAYSASRALVIGIGDVYATRGFASLQNAERDAEDIGEALKTLDSAWDVVSLIGPNATRAAIKNAFAALEHADKNERVLVYYAGHGERHENTDKVGYLIPADARPSDADPGRSSWISFDDVDRIFDTSPAKHILILMDCCYSGRLGSSRGTAATNAFDTLYLAQTAHHIIASAQTHQVAEDGDRGGNSPFAEGVLLAMRESVEKGDALWSSLLFSEIQKHMRSRTPRNIPRHMLGERSEGEFFLSFGEKASRAPP